MSRITTTTITCPDCGTGHEMKIWESVNVTLDKDAKKEVLNANLFKYKCKKCGKINFVEYPILYHDMEKKLLIQTVYSAEGEKAFKKNLKSIGKNMSENGDAFSEDYTIRIVRSVNQLREKVYLFDHDYDDRTIELMKLFQFFVLMKNPEIAVLEQLVDITDGEPENFVVRLDDGWAKIPFSVERYDDTDGMLLGSDYDTEEHNELIVDEEWAKRVFKKYLSKYTNNDGRRH